MTPVAGSFQSTRPIRLSGEQRQAPRSASRCRHLPAQDGLRTGKGQDAIRAVFRSLLGIPPGSAKATRRLAAARAVEAGQLDDEHWPHVNDLLDLDQPVELRSLYDAMDNATRNTGKRETLCELVRRKSVAKPQLVRIEDLHWADSVILDHIGTLGRLVADCSVVLVATSRVDGDPLEGGWRGQLAGEPLVTMALGPIRTADAKALAANYKCSQRGFPWGVYKSSRWQSAVSRSAVESCW